MMNINYTKMIIKMIVAQICHKVVIKSLGILIIIMKINTNLKKNINLFLRYNKKKLKIIRQLIQCEPLINQLQLLYLKIFKKVFLNKINY